MEKDLKQVFAENLKKYMARDDRNQLDIANLVGVSPSTASDWINGKKYPRMDKVEMLANYFGIRKSDLVEENSQSDRLTDDETLLLESFRKLDPILKKHILLSVQATTKR
jgi:transcriptional regulator with XRE-family HTH domain